MVYDAKGQIDKSKYVRETGLISGVTRVYETIAKAKDWTPKNRKGIHILVEEVVHNHQLYRSVDAKGKATQDRWFRGARVT